jgi:hypothetical protein
METLKPADVFRHNSGMGMEKGAAYAGGSSQEEIAEKRQTRVSKQVVIPTTLANPTARDALLSGGHLTYSPIRIGSLGPP